MKKLLPVFCAILMLPFVICSCFEAEIAGINLSESNIELVVGESKHITVSVTPDEAEIRKMTWKSSDNSIAAIDNGTIKAKSAGKAIITVTSEKGLVAECSVIVKNKDITEVVLSDIATSVKVGSRIQLSARLLPSDAPDTEVEWSSENESVAKVNTEGFVKGIKEGCTNIVCTASNGVQAVCRVTVKAVAPTNPSTMPTEETTEAPTTAENTYKPKDNIKVTEPPQSSVKPQSGDFMFPDSSTRRLSESEVSGLTKKQAQDAINEIFARNGYVFKTASLQSYYESKAWYHRNPNFSNSDLSAIESYNVGLFSKYR